MGQQVITTSVFPIGINKVFVDVANEIVLVDTTLPSSHVTQLLQGTGKLVVFRGIGGVPADNGSSRLHQGAAVAIMKGVGGVKGLARLVQVKVVVSQTCMMYHSRY